MLEIKYLNKKELFEMGKEWEQGFMNIDLDDLIDFYTGTQNGRFEMLQYTGNTDDFVKEFFDELKIIYPNRVPAYRENPINQYEFSVEDLGKITDFFKALYPFQRKDTDFCKHLQKYDNRNS